MKPEVNINEDLRKLDKKTLEGITSNLKNAGLTNADSIIKDAVFQV